jgi:hypothetical protein
MTALTGEELAQSGTLEELYDKLDKVGMGRGWNKPTPSLWASPRKTFRPTHWRYEQPRGALDAAGLLACVLNCAALGRDVREFGSVAAQGEHRAIRHCARRGALPAPRRLRGGDRPPCARSSRLGPTSRRQRIRIPGEQRRRRQDPQSARRRLGAGAARRLDELVASLKLRPLREYQPPGSTGPPLSAQSLKAPTL